MAIPTTFIWVDANGTKWQQTIATDGSFINTVVASGDPSVQPYIIESVSVEDLVRRALRTLGVISSGETPSAEEITDGMAALNELIASWATEKLMTYSMHRETFPLVAGQQTYTIGAGGDFVTNRPNRIEFAGLIPSGGTEIPLGQPLNELEWAELPDKARSGQPENVFYQKTWPTGTLWINPVPTAADTLVLYSWKQLGQYTDRNTTIGLPSEYMLALRYNLAVHLYPEYSRVGGLDPVIAGMAQTSKAAIKKMNSQPVTMKADAAVLPCSSGWDIRNG